VKIGAADADGDHADDDLVRARFLELDLVYVEPPWLEHHCGARPHRISMPPLRSSVEPVTKPAASLRRSPARRR
jgi:hypothetical protein